MDMLLDFVGELIFGILQEVLGAMLAGHTRARRMQAIQLLRSKPLPEIPAYFATFKRIAESK